VLDKQRVAKNSVNYSPTWEPPLFEGDSPFRMGFGSDVTVVLEFEAFGDDGIEEVVEEAAKLTEGGVDEAMEMNEDDIDIFME